MAKCGGVDYSWGADGLAKAHDYIITLLLYIVYLCYAIAGIVAVIASLQIYIKMNVGEEGIKKEIMMVIGAILFIISASIVMPALFGYQL
jgi:type IV secretory pathway VirB2 component (pilin)